MVQDIVTWIIVGICVLAAIVMIVRRLRGRKRKSCGCGCGGDPSKKGDRVPSADACSGCSLAELCKKK